VWVRPVVMLALAGLLALIVALLTGSTPMAVLVIALAVAGIVALFRNWRDERRHAAEPGPAETPGGGSDAGGSRADEFSPDISGDPDGPSSDARAD